MPGQATMLVKEATTTESPKTTVAVGPRENEDAVADYRFSQERAREIYEYLCFHRVAVTAYYLWQKRGCPIGSDQEDWFQAEALLEYRYAWECRNDWSSLALAV
jgi:Protein of unknown function (DUF2934)